MCLCPWPGTEAEKIFTQTVAAILVISAVITLGVSLFAEPLAYFLGAGPQTIGYTSQYLHIVCLFSLCFILSYCLEVMVKVDGAPSGHAGRGRQLPDQTSA